MENYPFKTEKETKMFIFITFIQQRIGNSSHFNKAKKFFLNIDCGVRNNTVLIRDYMMLYSKKFNESTKIF